MSERAGREREKAETLIGSAEVGGDKVQEWLSDKWGNARRSEGNRGKEEGRREWAGERKERQTD